MVSDISRIQLDINHNGIPAYRAASAAEAIIRMRTNAVTAQDMAGVPDEIVALMTANDSVYERRRVAWVKLTFIPAFTSYVQNVGDSTDSLVSGYANEIIYVVSDSNGLNKAVTSTSSGSVNDPAALLANNTGVKLKKLNRTFKVFRKSRKFPMFPISIQANGQDFLAPSGRWMSSTATDAEDTQPHTSITTQNIDFPADTRLFTCVHEIKYVWCDRRGSATFA